MEHVSAHWRSAPRPHILPRKGAQGMPEWRVVQSWSDVPQADLSKSVQSFCTCACVLGGSSFGCGAPGAELWIARFALLPNAGGGGVFSAYKACVPPSHAALIKEGRTARVRTMSKPNPRRARRCLPVTVERGRISVARRGSCCGGLREISWLTG